MISWRASAIENGACAYRSLLPTVDVMCSVLLRAPRIDVSSHMNAGVSRWGSTDTSLIRNVGIDSSCQLLEAGYSSMWGSSAPSGISNPCWPNQRCRATVLAGAENSDLAPMRRSKSCLWRGASSSSALRNPHRLAVRRSSKIYAGVFCREFSVCGRLTLTWPSPWQCTQPFRTV